MRRKQQQLVKELFIVACLAVVVIVAGWVTYRLYVINNVCPYVPTHQACKIN